MNLLRVFVLSVFTVLFGSGSQARSVEIPDFEELLKTSDVVLIASLESLTVDQENSGNAISSTAQIKVHLRLKGDCDDDTELGHLIDSSDVPKMPKRMSANDYRRIDWLTKLRTSNGVLVPEEKRLYLIFAKKTGDKLEAFRTSSGDCFGVFAIDGPDADLARFFIDERAGLKEQERSKGTGAIKRDGGSFGETTR